MNQGLRAHRTSVDPKLLDDARNRLTAAVTGLFGSLAFREVIVNTNDLRSRGRVADGAFVEQGVLALTFVLTGLAFMAGIIVYLVALRPRARQRDWVWDFSFSVLTLSILVFMGLNCKQTEVEMFLFSYFGIFTVQIVWSLYHYANNVRVPFGWLPVNTAAAAWVWLTISFVPDTWKHWSALILSILHFFYDFFVIGATPNSEPSIAPGPSQGQ